MGKLMWLASYPKSGNTWVRAFLANYLTDSAQPVDINTLASFAVGDMRIEQYVRVGKRPAESLKPADIDRLRPLAHRSIAEMHPGSIFVKTHSVIGRVGGTALITPEVTAGAVYVVRNPLDVAVSFADHYGLTLDQVTKAICFNRLRIDPRPDQVTQHLSDWSTHVKSWRDAPGLRHHLVRYEDLTDAPEASFTAIVQFLKAPLDTERLQRAIAHSSFPVLAGQEHERGFRERSRSAEKFFRSGKVGGWREVLDARHSDAIVAFHREVMGQLGYIDADGTLRI